MCFLFQLPITRSAWIGLFVTHQCWLFLGWLKLVTQFRRHNMDVLVITRCISILQDIRKHNSIWFWLPNKLDRQQIHRQANAIPNLVVGKPCLYVCSGGTCTKTSRRHQATRHDFQGATWISRWKNSWTGAVSLPWATEMRTDFAELPWHFSVPQYPEAETIIQLECIQQFNQFANTEKFPAYVCLRCPEPGNPGSLKIARHGLSFSRWHCTVSWLGAGWPRILGWNGHHQWEWWGTLYLHIWRAHTHTYIYIYTLCIYIFIYVQRVYLICIVYSRRMLAGCEYELTDAWLFSEPRYQ